MFVWTDFEGLLNSKVAVKKIYCTELKIIKTACLLGSALLSCTLMPSGLIGNPSGGTVTQGSATFSVDAGHLTVNQSSHRAVINWQDFSIQPGELTKFNQPSPSSAALSRVVGVNPSSIYGTLQANGQIYLVNPHGILIGPTGVIQAQSFTASTLDVADSEFMAGGAMRFVGESGAQVKNLGTITAAGGDVFLIGKEVVNGGGINAMSGTVGLAGGTEVVLTPAGVGGNKIAVAVNAGSGCVSQSGTIQAVSAELRAAGGNPYALAINNTGIIKARGVENQGGRIFLKAHSGAISHAGTMESQNADGTGGTIQIESGGAVQMSGDVSADGISGGSVKIQGCNISLADRIHARGTDGKGGSLEIVSDGRIIENSGSRNDVSGATDGGVIQVKGGQNIATSGSYRAEGVKGQGGIVDLSAPDVRLFSTQIDASGATEGGSVRIGGAFQGGKSQESDTQAERFVNLFTGENRSWPEIANAQKIFVNDGTKLDVSATSGQGGTVVVWSDVQTTFLGSIMAGGSQGTTNGGAVEISSGDALRYADLSRITGASRLLLDPKNITIGTAIQTQSWTYQGIIGAGYPAAGKNVVMSLDADDLFGISVTLNGNGDRLAVGAIWDDGATNANAKSGAVYLFSFSDTSFSGGTLQGTIGSGYAGGKNVGVPELEPSDFFGHSVLLNPSGDRLVVGAYGDDGFGNTTTDSGAAYLFSFSDTHFSGGTLQGIMGKGYSGGKNVDLASLDSNDYFGISVSMNAAGDRLAVGVSQDGGFGNASFKSGAVYLFGFSDTNFSGGTLQGIIGKGYGGGKNVNVGSLEVGDLLGHGVSLNASGTRLAVGAYGDDAFGNAVTDSGAVYLFSFSDGNFSGGTVEGIVGSGYSGGKNVGVVELEAGDRFGTSVSRNSAGDRLAVGGFGDDGFGNAVTDSGAVYLFSFSDTDFGGGTLQGIMGSGYAGGGNVDVGTLDPSDYFGISVTQNASGNRLAVGAHYDDGFGNSLANCGAVYLFSATVSGGAETAGSMLYANQANVDVTFNASQIAFVLSQGTAVTLQANNDITVSSAITANNLGGNGGALMLQAGRSIWVNANITTDNGNLSLLANDTLANGVVDAYRSAGNAVITMGAGSVVNAGTGSLNFTLSTGAGLTQNASGDISLQTVIGDAVTVANHGVTAGSDLIFNGGITATQLTATTDNGVIAGSSGAVQVSGTTVLSSGGTITLNNATNRISRLGTVTRGGALTLLDSEGGLTIDGSVGGHASDVEIVTTGNLTLGSAGSVSATEGGNIYLAAQSGNFINNAGAGSLSLGSGRWIIYSGTESAMVRGGLVESSVRQGTYSAHPPASWVGTAGNLFVIAPPPATTTVPAETTAEMMGRYPVLMIRGTPAVSGGVAVVNPDGNAPRLIVAPNGHIVDVGFNFMAILNSPASENTILTGIFPPLDASSLMEPSHPANRDSAIPNPKRFFNRMD